MRTKTIAGYTDKLSVAPGETVRFLVSCDDGAASYRAGIVRLICTDDHPEGPGLIERPVKTSVDGEYPARLQPIHAGSYAVVPSGPALALLESFTVQAMIWPTTPAKGRQSLLGTWSEETRAGFALEIDETGALALRIGDGEGDGEVCSTGKALPAREWALAAASYDAATGEVHVYQEPVVDQAPKRCPGPRPYDGQGQARSHRKRIAGHRRPTGPEARTAARSWPVTTTARSTARGSPTALSRGTRSRP